MVAIKMLDFDLTKNGRYKSCCNRRSVHEIRCGIGLRLYHATKATVRCIARVGAVRKLNIWIVTDFIFFRQY